MVGGADRLAAWVQESPENEKAFWTTIYPKLLPLQVNAKGVGFALGAPVGAMSDAELEAMLRPQLSRDEWVERHVPGMARDG